MANGDGKNPPRITLTALPFPSENLIDFMSPVESQRQKGSLKCLVVIKHRCNASDGRVDSPGVSSLQS